MNKKRTNKLNCQDLTDKHSVNEKMNKMNKNQKIEK